MEYLIAMALALTVLPIVETEKAVRRWLMRRHRKEQEGTVS